MQNLFNKLALTFREFGDFLEQQEMKVYTLKTL